MLRFLDVRSKDSLVISVQATANQQQLKVRVLTNDIETAADVVQSLASAHLHVEEL